MNAKMWGNQKKKQSAEEYPTPSCNEFYRIKKILENIWGH